MARKTIKLKARTGGQTLAAYAKSKGIDIGICGVKGKVSKADEKELKKLIDELASGKAVMTIPVKAMPLRGIISPDLAALHSLRNDLQADRDILVQCPFDTDNDGNCGQAGCPYCGKYRTTITGRFVEAVYPFRPWWMVPRHTF